MDLIKTVINSKKYRKYSKINRHIKAKHPSKQIHNLSKPKHKNIIIITYTYYHHINNPNEFHKKLTIKFDQINHNIN